MPTAEASRAVPPDASLPLGTDGVLEEDDMRLSSTAARRLTLVTATPESSTSIVDLRARARAPLKTSMSSAFRHEAAWSLFQKLRWNSWATCTQVFLAFMLATSPLRAPWRSARGVPGAARSKAAIKEGDDAMVSDASVSGGTNTERSAADNIAHPKDLKRRQSNAWHQAARYRTAG